MATCYCELSGVPTRRNESGDESEAAAAAMNKAAMGEEGETAETAKNEAAETAMNKAH